MCGCAISTATWLATLSTGWRQCQLERFMVSNAEGRPKLPYLRAALPRYPKSLRRRLRCRPDMGQAEATDPERLAIPLAEIKANPEAKRQERFLSDEEVKRLLAACRLSIWPRLRLLALMAVTTGARREELLALRFGDLDLTATHSDRSPVKEWRSTLAAPNPRCHRGIEANRRRRAESADLTVRAEARVSRSLSTPAWRRAL